MTNQSNAFSVVRLLVILTKCCEYTPQIPSCNENVDTTECLLGFISSALSALVLYFHSIVARHGKQSSLFQCFVVLLRMVDHSLGRLNSSNIRISFLDVVCTSRIYISIIVGTLWLLFLVCISPTTNKRTKYCDFYEIRKWIRWCIICFA